MHLAGLKVDAPAATPFVISSQASATEVDTFVRRCLPKAMVYLPGPEDWTLCIKSRVTLGKARENTGEELARMFRPGHRAVAERIVYLGISALLSLSRGGPDTPSFSSY